MHKIKFTIDDIIKLIKENKAYYITYECYKNILDDGYTYKLKDHNNKDFVCSLTTCSIDNEQIIRKMHDHELSFIIQIMLECSGINKNKIFIFEVIYHENGYNITLDENKSNMGYKLPKLNQYAIDKINEYKLLETI